MLELDSPLSMSLLEYTKGSTDIGIVLNMTDDDIDDLYYYRESSKSSPQAKVNNVNSNCESETTVRTKLAKGYKRLLKIFTSFGRYLKDS